MKNKGIITALILILIAVMTADGFIISNKISGGAEPVITENQTVTVSETQAAPTEPSYDEVSLVAVGDNLIHDTLIAAGEQKDGSRDYSAFYEHIEEDVKAADMAIVNQETILGGDVAAYTGYPLFNSPQEIGDAAVNAGFDIFTCATNHSMDVGVRGIESELNYFNEKYPGIVHLGLNADEEEYNTITYYECNNIKFALLNYTYGTNGIPLPESKPWIVNLLDKEKVTADLKEARANADVVIVFPHWGTEYSTSVSDYQKDYTSLFLENGVDIVIGCHPHVIEPVRKFVNENSGREMVVFYSLGNFISHQHDLADMLGGMAKITVKKENDAITITSAKIVPLVTYYKRVDSGYYFTTYKLSDYTDALASTHRYDYATPEKFRSLYEEIIDEEFRE